MNKTFNKVFFYIFASLWAVFTILNMFMPKKTFSETENRYLATFPKFTLETLINGQYMPKVEEYLNDHFIFRDEWISIKTFAEKLMLKTDSNSVYFGKDGYLIEKRDEIDEELAKKNLEYLANFIEMSVNKFGTENVSTVIVPTASEILKDKLPLFATDYDQTILLEMISSRLPNDVYVDVTETLKAHKEEYIYYKTDHHWTQHGAYYAYEAWAKSAGFTPLSKEEFNIVMASDEFYGTLHAKVNVNVSPDEIYLYEIKKDMQYNLLYNFNEKRDSIYQMSALDTRDKYTVFMGGNHPVIEIGTNNTNGRKLLVIKDSFAHSFVPFVINHYEETHMIDLRHFNMDITQYMEDEGITDVLVMYNTFNFVTDTNFIKLS